jgi:hypothetical protein
MLSKQYLSNKPKHLGIKELLKMTNTSINHNINHPKPSDEL